MAVSFGPKTLDFTYWTHITLLVHKLHTRNMCYSELSNSVDSSTVCFNCITKEEMCIMYLIYT